MTKSRVSLKSLSNSIRSMMKIVKKFKLKRSVKPKSKKRTNRSANKKKKPAKRSTRKQSRKSQKSSLFLDSLLKYQHLNNPYGKVKVSRQPFTTGKFPGILSQPQIPPLIQRDVIDVPFNNANMNSSQSGFPNFIDDYEDI